MVDMVRALRIAALVTAVGLFWILEWTGQRSLIWLPSAIGFAVAVHSLLTIRALSWGERTAAIGLMIVGGVCLAKFYSVGGWLWIVVAALFCAIAFVIPYRALGRRGRSSRLR